VSAIDMPSAAGGVAPGGWRRRGFGRVGHRAEQQMRAIFARREPRRCAHADAHRLRLAGRERDLARGMVEHVERGGLGGARLGLVDRADLARLVHPPQHQRDAIGGGALPGVADDHLAAAHRAQHEPGGGDEEIALRARGGRRQRQAEARRQHHQADHGQFLRLARARVIDN